MADNDTPTKKQGGYPFASTRREIPTPQKVDKTPLSGLTAQEQLIASLNEKKPPKAQENDVPGVGQDETPKTSSARATETSSPKAKKKLTSSEQAEQDELDALNAFDEVLKNDSSDKDFKTKTQKIKNKEVQDQIADIPEGEKNVRDGSSPAPEGPSKDKINHLRDHLVDHGGLNVEVGRNWYVEKYAHVYNEYSGKWSYKWKPDVDPSQEDFVKANKTGKLFDLGSVQGLGSLKDGVNPGNIPSILKSKITKQYETDQKFDRDSVFATAPGGNPLAKIQLSTKGEVAFHNFKFANAEQKHWMAEQAYIANRQFNPDKTLGLTGSTDSKMRMHMAFNYKFDENGKLVERQDADKVKTWYTPSDSNVAKWKARLEKEHKKIGTLETSSEEEKTNAQTGNKSDQKSDSGDSTEKHTEEKKSSGNDKNQQTDKPDQQLGSDGVQAPGVAATKETLGVTPATPSDGVQAPGVAPTNSGDLTRNDLQKKDQATALNSGEPPFSPKALLGAGGTNEANANANWTMHKDGTGAFTDANGKTYTFIPDGKGGLTVRSDKDNKIVSFVQDSKGNWVLAGDKAETKDLKEGAKALPAGEKTPVAGDLAKATAEKMDITSIGETFKDFMGRLEATTTPSAPMTKEQVAAARTARLEDRKAGAPFDDSKVKVPEKQKSLANAYKELKAQRVAELDKKLDSDLKKGEAAKSVDQRTARDYLNSLKDVSGEGIGSALPKNREELKTTATASPIKTVAEIRRERDKLGWKGSKIPLTPGT